MWCIETQEWKLITTHPEDLKWTNTHTHTHTFNCNGYILSNVLLHHTSSSIPFDDVVSSHWIASRFNNTPPFLWKIGVALNFIFPPSYSLRRCWNAGIIWAYGGIKSKKLKFITIEVDCENHMIRMFCWWCVCVEYLQVRILRSVLIECVCYRSSTSFITHSACSIV
jgi:hypothetical protein